MNRINILDDLTINKIAAGEVVERPSSVVKELIENCVDAGSTKVIIDILDGGKKLIKIIDNGSGIASSEVEKSFLRHATSKINKIDDLYDLYSLGFRGEALASISAVSKLEMITKTKDEPVGTKVYVEGGKIVSKEPIGANNGTTIIIKDIFYNTPVRQKFLKSTHAETINISDLINKLAIGNPNVQFRYVNNNKPMLNTPGDGRLLSVIRSIYGKDICDNLIEINYECKHFKLNGYIGNNNVYRSNKNLQHIYINKRFVKSKVVLDAISEAYKSIVPINKHAVCFLNIIINPSSIDVNIHPTKLEIKFENEQELYIELRDYLKSRLLHTNLIGKYEVKESKSNLQLQPKIEVKEMEKPPIKVDKNIEVIKIDSEKPIDTFLSVTDILSKKEDIYKDKKDTTYMNERVYESTTYINDYDIDKNNDFSDKVKDMYNSKAMNEYKINSLDDIEQDIDYLNYEDNNNLNEFIEDEQQKFFEDSNDKTKFSLDDYNIIGTIFDTYIILSKGESMYLVDQHVAHERVLYERYMDKFYSSDINMQVLLNPDILELSNVDMIKVEQNLELFKNFGFEIDIFGNNHIMIRCVPTVFGVPESEKFILEIIDNIDDIKSNYELKGEKFASMACRAAIKANDKINTLEIKSLFEQMKECKNPFTCPHGRPIIVEITKTEIEKMFKRIMN